MTVPAATPEPTPPHVAEWLRQTVADHTPGPVDDIDRLRDRIQEPAMAPAPINTVDERQHGPHPHGWLLYSEAASRD